MPDRARYEVTLRLRSHPDVRAVFHCDATDIDAAERKAMEGERCRRWTVHCARLSGPALGRPDTFRRL